MVDPLCRQSNVRVEYRQNSIEICAFSVSLSRFGRSTYDFRRNTLDHFEDRRMRKLEASYSEETLSKPSGILVSTINPS